MKCSEIFRQLSSMSSKASLAVETTGGKILVAFWPKHDFRSNLRVPNFKNFPGGACPQTPLPCYLTLSYALLVPQHIGCTNLKYLAPALYFRPDGDWTIQSKRRQVIFRTQVGNR